MRRLLVFSFSSSLSRLILGHLEKNLDSDNCLPVVMEKVVNTMNAVIKRTADAMNKEPPSASPKSKELQLIQSKTDIETPPTTFRAVRVD